MKENNLIFVSSLPRSGSTLLQRLIGEYDSVYTESEPWVMLPVVDLRCELAIESVYGRNTAVNAIADFLKGVEPRLIDQATKHYALSLYGAKLPENKSIFLDKTPRYYLIAEQLELLFPEAHHIYIKRNPLAILVSIYNSWIKDDLDALINYQVDLVDGIRLLEGRISRTAHKVISYESLISDPQSVLSNVQAYLGFDGHDVPVKYSSTETEWSLGDQRRVNSFTTPTDKFKYEWIDSLDDEILWNIVRQYLDSLDNALLTSLGYDKCSLQSIVTDSCSKYCHKEIDIKIAGFSLLDFFKPSNVYKSKESFYELRVNNSKLLELSESNKQKNDALINQLTSRTNENLDLEKELASRTTENLDLEKELASRTTENLDLEKELTSRTNEFEQLKTSKRLRMVNKLMTPLDKTRILFRKLNKN